MRSLFPRYVFNDVEQCLTTGALLFTVRARGTAVLRVPRAPQDFCKACLWQVTDAKKKEQDETCPVSPTPRYTKLSLSPISYISNHLPASARAHSSAFGQFGFGCTSTSTSFRFINGSAKGGL